MLPFIRKNTEYQIHSIQWINEKPMLAVLGQMSDGSGVLKIFRLVKNDLVPEHGNCHFMTMPTGMKTIGGDLVISELKQLSIWDVHDLVYPKSVIEIKNTAQCMDCYGGCKDQPGPPEIVIGCAKKVEIYDIRQNLPVVEIFENMQPWAVAIGGASEARKRSVAVGFDQGTIKIYDLENRTCVWEIKVIHGVCCLEFDRRDSVYNKLTVGCLRGDFHVFQLSNLNKVKHLTVKNKQEPYTIWTLSHSPHYKDGFIVCVNNVIQLFRYEYGKTEDQVKLVDSVANLTEQPIRAFQWNDKIVGLCAFASFDQVLCVLMAPAVKNCQ
eukprot:NODE_615_length_5971_cov_0.202486.p2 type:complete len:324 gc:universal NODE_615_length_5971_cov_0.202486:1098-2069(+)